MQIQLEQLSIATPCRAEWKQMAGDDRVRFCSQCQLNVYNLSGMSREEAAQLVQRSEGRLCVRMLRRQDGTVITRDCSVGRRMLHRQVAQIVGGTLSVVAILGTSILALAGWISPRQDSLIAQWHNALRPWMSLDQPQPIAGECVYIPPVAPPSPDGVGDMDVKPSAE